MERLLPIDEDYYLWLLLVQTRRAVLKVREKGRQAYYQSLKRESIHKVFSSLSGEQRRQLRSCLETLRHKALEELSLAKKMPLPPAP